MEKIEEFIKREEYYCYGNGSGRGYGDGFGCGYGDGYGYGYGDGNGTGFGYGDGSGYGSDFGDGDDSGYGFGCEIKSLNGKKVYNIDEIETIITNVSKNIAKGYILNDDLTLTPCYIAKGQNKFAHGETIKEAVKALEEKIYEELDTEEAIEQFMEHFKQYNRKYKANELYKWHHILTGSCEMGRKQFAKEHNIDIDNDKISIKEFVELTKNSYGGDIIKQLKERYEEQGRKE